jgi:hypothetical protein
MKCTLCFTEIAGINEAIDADWIPNFFVGATEHGPVCPSCQQKYLWLDSIDGEFDLSTEFVNIFLKSASYMDSGFKGKSYIGFCGDIEVSEKCEICTPQCEKNGMKPLDGYVNTAPDYSI